LRTSVFGATALPERRDPGSGGQDNLIPDDATMRAMFAHAGFESIEIENRDDRHVLTARKSPVLCGR